MKNEEYIDINKIAELKGLKSNRSLRLAIQKGKYIAREVKVFGGKSYEILYSSLEPEIQEKLQDELIKEATQSNCTALVPLNSKDLSPNVEIYSIDEAFVDVTGLVKVYNKNYYTMAKYIQDRIWNEVGMPVSIGISRSKTLQEELEKGMPSYIGTSIEDKPAWLKRGEHLHQEWHKRLTNNHIPTVQEAIKYINSWLELHNSQPCPNNRNMTIKEMLNSVQKQDIPVQVLDDLMMKTETIDLNGGGQGGKAGLYYVKNGTKKGYDEAHVGDGISLAYPHSKLRRGRVGKGCSQTLDTSCNMGTIDNYRIRRLTPLECFRLQGFPDDMVECGRKIGLVDGHLYKMAGNAVTVNVIETVARKLAEVVYGTT